MVERLSHQRVVTGSSPVFATMFLLLHDGADALCLRLQLCIE
jgi:hypothetical protein